MSRDERHCIIMNGNVSSIGLFLKKIIKQSHCYLLRSMILIEFVPLLKDKNGDISDVNNYRAIALANVETKIP